MNVKKMYLPRLSNDLHIWYHRQVHQHIDRYELEELGVSQDELDAYKAAIDAEESMLHRARTSAYTAKMQACDAQRDAYFRNFYHTLKNLGTSPVAERNAAYNDILPILKEFPLGILNIATKEKTTRIASFLEKIHSKLSAKFATYDLQGTYDALKSANDNYSLWAGFRTSESAEAIAGELVQSRLHTDGLYAKLVQLIEYQAARAEDEGAMENCQKITESVNETVVECKRRLKIIASYNAKKNAGENVTEEDLKDALDGKDVDALK